MIEIIIGFIFMFIKIFIGFCMGWLWARKYYRNKKGYFVD